MSGLILIQSVWHSDVIPARFFFKVDFETKKISRRQKSIQIIPEGKEFIFTWNEFQDRTATIIQTVYDSDVKVYPPHTVSGHHQLASGTPFQWRFAGGPMKARI